MYRETHLRSVVKAVSWRFWATLTTDIFTNFNIVMLSAKGCQAYDRYMTLSCPINKCKSQELPPSNSPGRSGLVISAGQILGSMARHNRHDRNINGNIENSFFYGISLGARGITVFDYIEKHGFLYNELDGGYRSDPTGASSQAANAHAAMLNALVGVEFGQPGCRFLTLNDACAIIRIALEAQRSGWRDPRGSYVWGSADQGNFRPSNE